MIREAVAAKARRYLVEQRVTVTRVVGDVVDAVVQGDTGEHHVGHDPARGWRCTCSARGRCSHVAALKLVTVRKFTARVHESHLTSASAPSSQPLTIPTEQEQPAPRAQAKRPANPDQLSLLDLLPHALLAAYWRDANERWFGGELSPVPIVADYTSRPGLLGTYGLSKRTGKPVITINALLLENLGDPGPRLAATDVVLHEMVHQYVDTCTDADEPSHGPTFTAMCNKIGAWLGLGEVTQRKPRGRRGSVARYWPVRPAGAYGPDNPRLPIGVRRMVTQSNKLTDNPKETPK